MMKSLKEGYSLDMQIDYSKLYENVVFNHLRRRYTEIFYFSEGKEIDLLCA